ncbi:hypothetical protein TcCL_Unassigned03373 [Trypanosoma cruzi]|nr:hypothetical protein TcCL_Unassigned03373 [Trypanosoma cruzi]
MVDGKTAGKADKAKRTAHASACMIRKGFLFHFHPAILTSPEYGTKTAPHPRNNASVMMAAHCLFRGLDDSLTVIFSMLCRNHLPKPTADGGRFVGDVSSTIPRLTADNRRRTALRKKY